MKRELIKYFKTLGIEVYTNTKARGHQGFFLKNRIDISKNIKEEKVIPTLLHEFAHFIHSKIEPDIIKTGGTIETLFNIKSADKTKNPQKYIILNLFQNFVTSDEIYCETNNNPYLSCKELEEELIAVTNFVDENSHLTKLKARRETYKRKIKALETEIKKDYPHFMRSKKFKEFDKYIKKSKAKYLLKYDRVKFITPFLRREEFFSIDNIEKDFPEMSSAFCAYIRLKSSQKRQARISAKINRLNKYYLKPTELFARFIEGIYIDEAKTRFLAPNVTKRFFELLENGYYLEMKDIFQLISGLSTDITDLSPKYLIAQS